MNGKAQPTVNTRSQYAMDELVGNALLSRAQLMQSFLDPRRNLNEDCGYPSTSSLTAADYKDMFDREPIAGRVVEYLPMEAWKATPTVFESDDPDTVTPFELAWDNLSRSLRGQSWYQDEKGSPVWEHLKRAHINSRIGHFGILLIGIDDGRDLREPADFVFQQDPFTGNLVPMPMNNPLMRTMTQPTVEGVPSKVPDAPNAPKTPRRLTFLRSFDESLIQITQIEQDRNNVRYGLPTMYSVTVSDPNNLAGTVASGLPTGTVDVHWTRVIHLAEGLLSSEIFAIPPQQQVWNRLYDLQKLYGGSAEMYWRGAFPGLSFETHPNIEGLEVDPDKAGADGSTMRTQVFDYMNTLQRYLMLTGMTTKSLAPQVSDPSAQIDVQLTAICIKLRVPKRKFMGSERGELASSQDDGDWNDTVREYQDGYVTPRIIVPFVDRLIQLGVLPPPVGFSVAWPDLDSLAAGEKADIMVKMVDAIVKYVQGGGDQLFDPLDFLTRVMGFDEDDAKVIIDNVVKHLEEANPEADQDIVPGRNPPPSMDQMAAEAELKAKSGAGSFGKGGKSGQEEKA